MKFESDRIKESSPKCFHIETAKRLAGLHIDTPNTQRERSPLCNHKIIYVTALDRLENCKS